MTRLGDFSPSGRLFALGSLKKERNIGIGRYISMINTSESMFATSRALNT
jgi:hypothetical protein